MCVSSSLTRCEARCHLWDSLRDRRDGLTEGIGRARRSTKPCRLNLVGHVGALIILRTETVGWDGSQINAGKRLVAVLVREAVSTSGAAWRATWRHHGIHNVR